MTLATNLIKDCSADRFTEDRDLFRKYYGLWSGNSTNHWELGYYLGLRNTNGQAPLYHALSLPIQELGVGCNPSL
jgi:hypothetical protein